MTLSVPLPGSSFSGDAKSGDLEAACISATIFTNFCLAEGGGGWRSLSYELGD